MYTKGKWTVEVDECDGSTNISTETQNICRMCYDDKHTLKANAHLITTAVNACIKLNSDNPMLVAESIGELYEACKLAQQYFRACFAVWEKGERIMPSDEEVVRVAGNELDNMADIAMGAMEQAISKAEV